MERHFFYAYINLIQKTKNKLINNLINKIIISTFTSSVNNSLNKRTMETKKVIPKGRYAQLFSNFKVGEQMLFTRTKGHLARLAICRLGISDQFTSWSVYDADRTITGIVIHRLK